MVGNHWLLLWIQKHKQQERLIVRLITAKDQFFITLTLFSKTLSFVLKIFELN